MIQLTTPRTPPENVQCPVPDGRADVRIDLSIAGAANLAASDDGDQALQRLSHRILTVGVAQLVDATQNNAASHLDPLGEALPCGCFAGTTALEQCVQLPGHHSAGSGARYTRR